MQRTGRPSWQMGEDASWPLTVALYVRDALRLPATAPFFIPPLAPAVPEHVPVIGPDLDIVLAGEWVEWFSVLLVDHRGIPRGGHVGYFSLGGRAPAFAAAVETCFDAASTAATQAFEAYLRTMMGPDAANRLAINALVRSVEKELGRRAAPFKLSLTILPVEGFWLHRAGPSEVLMSQAARMDAEQLRRLLGPVIRELA